jgi:hypothetical protein
MKYCRASDWGSVSAEFELTVIINFLSVSTVTRLDTVSLIALSIFAFFSVFVWFDRDDSTELSADISPDFNSFCTSSFLLN